MTRKIAEKCKLTSKDQDKEIEISCITLTI